MHISNRVKPEYGDDADFTPKVVRFIQRAYNTRARKMMYTNESDSGNSDSQPPSTDREAVYTLQYQ